jgi:ADP-ribosylglycohydrolase
MSGNLRPMARPIDGPNKFSSLRPIYNRATFTHPRFRGCLIGGAIGDALGMPVENMTRQQITAKYGPRIEGFFPKPNRGLKAGQWTDDTILTLATLESLTRSGCFIPSNVAYNLQLAFDRGKRTHRGFGTATKMALTRISQGAKWSEASVGNEDALGNGAAMRIAPIALFSYRDLYYVKNNSYLVAKITHNNEEAINGAIAIAFVIAKIMNGSFKKETILPETMDFIGPSKLSAKINFVFEKLRSPAIDLEPSIREIGLSGSVLDSVPASLFFFLCFIDSFKEAVVNAVSFGGDADTIGSLVGQLGGAYHGESAIPLDWKSGVEDGKKILDKADKLHWMVHSTTSF